MNLDWKDPFDEFELNLDTAMVNFGKIYDVAMKSEGTNAATKEIIKKGMMALATANLQLGSIKHYARTSYDLRMEKEMLQWKIKEQDKLLTLYNIATDLHDMEKLAEIFESPESAGIVKKEFKTVLDNCRKRLYNRTLDKKLLTPEEQGR